MLVKTGFADFAQQARAASRGSFWSWTNQLYVNIEDFVLAAVYVSFTFVVRLTILVLATPLLLLVSFTGFVDGLIRRDLRKFGAGRESSFVYHRAKRAVIPLLIVPWVIYLSLPFSINPIAVPWSPMARGRLTRPYVQQTERTKTDISGQSFYQATEVEDGRVIVVVEQIAGERGVPMAQIALAWVLAKRGVSAPIVGASKATQLDDAIAALELVLSEEEVKRLETPYVPHAVTGFS